MMMCAIGKKYSWHDDESWVITIPVDTILSVDRIYVRRGVSNYSSITFTVPKTLNKKSKFAGTRFWTKLSDANKIEFDLLSCNEDTLNLIKKIDEKTKLVLPSIAQSVFMRMLLDGKTINNARPQEPPSHFVLSVYNVIKIFCVQEKIDAETKLKLERALISFIRAYKLASLPIDDIYADATAKFGETLQKLSE